MKTLPAALVLAAMLVAPPGHALSKCLARDGAVTYTDKNCHGYGRALKLKLRDTGTYSSRETTQANLAYASGMASERLAAEHEAAAAQARGDAEIAAAKAASDKRGKEQARLAIVPLPPMDFDHGRHGIPAGQGR